MLRNWVRVGLVAFAAAGAGMSWLNTASAGSSRPSSAALRATSASVSCIPSSLELSQTATCTAVVSDTDTGSATTPTGDVAFSATSPTAFPSPSVCTLSAGTCQMTYTAWGGAPSTVTITASYGGDASHAPSTGTQDIAVSPFICDSSCPQPPPIIVHIAVTHKHPVAGRRFTGLAFTPVGGARITRLVCGAQIGNKRLRALKQRFYAGGVPGPAAVTCGWRIPAGAGGKRLSLAAQDGRACVFLVQEGAQSTTEVCGPVVSWHIKP